MSGRQPIPRRLTPAAPYTKKFSRNGPVKPASQNTTPPSLPCDSCKEFCTATMHCIEAYHDLFLRAKTLVVLDTVSHRMEEDGWWRLLQLLDLDATLD